MNESAFLPQRPTAKLAAAFTSALLLAVPALSQQGQLFTPGNLVVTVEGCGVNQGTCLSIPNGTGNGSGNSSQGGYGDNQAAPLTLFQYTPIGTSSATYVNSFVLPQTASGNNLPVSGEYGSSSEGTIQLSGSGQYLTLMGYGVNASSFDANPTLFGAAPSLALGQSGSRTGQSYTPVPRVIALIDSNGNVNSSTGLFNIYDTNNPRSIFTVDGATAYVSGQGNGSDVTGGVFFTSIGAINDAPTPITGLDTTNNTLSQDTREVQIVNNTLYISVDTKEGSGSARDFIATLGTPGTLPTTAPAAPGAGAPVMLNGYGNSGGTSKVTLTTGANGNGNDLSAGMQVNLSPENYFFANTSTLYVADSGNPKNNSSNNTTVGNGGLEKWINSKADGSGTWSLAYTLYKNLNLVGFTAPAGTTGLYGLTGAVSGSTVQLYTTNATINDLDATFLYGITDTLADTTASQAASESFVQLAAAPTDSNFKGVSFTPTVITKTTPTITWSAPAAITFGSALSSIQLNATASVPGTFTYTPAAGTVLLAGSGQTLSVTFTPTDTTDFNAASASTTITVNPAPPTTPASLVVNKVLTRSGGNVVAQITITNNGGTAAANVTITSVKIGADSATPAPQTLGAIPAGSSATATVTVPSSVGASGAASSFVLSGTFTGGGTFSSSARIVLP
jgi:hypothetical protein